MRFFLKWVDSGEEVCIGKIVKSDLDILDFTLSQREGGIALCSLTIPLSSILKKDSYAFLIAKHNEKMTPLFYGKLMGVPLHVSDLQQKIELFAVPKDYRSQLEKIKKEAHQTAEWDELFVDVEKREDPTEILESRPELFCWNPVTHQVTLSNFFVGRVNRTFNESQILQNSLKIKIGQLPKPYINLSVVAEWVQEAEGEINLFPFIEKKFSGGKINTLTPKSLLIQWPRKGQLLGRSGYAIVESHLQPFNPPMTGSLGIYPHFTDQIELLDENAGAIRLRQTWLNGKLKLGWCYKQKRREIVKLKLNHRHQMLSRSEANKLDLTLRLSDLSKHLPTPATPSFFETERGKQAIGHALKIASCHLAPSSRTYEITIKVPITEALGITLDETITIYHPALTKGSAKGKLVSYKLHASFEKSWAQLTIAMAAGEDGEVKIDGFNLVAEAELEGLPLPETLANSDFIDALSLRNDAFSQSQIIKQKAPRNKDELRQILQDNQTEIIFTLRDIRSKDVLERQFVVDTPLFWSAPKQV